MGRGSEPLRFRATQTAAFQRECGVLLQGLLGGIRDKQRKLQEAHERTKTVTRTGEMKDIRERMQVAALHPPPSTFARPYMPERGCLRCMRMRPMAGPPRCARSGCRCPGFPRLLMERVAAAVTPVLDRKGRRMHAPRDRPAAQRLLWLPVTLGSLGYGWGVLRLQGSLL